MPLPRIFSPLVPLTILAPLQAVALLAAGGLLLAVLARHRQATGDPSAGRLTTGYLLAQAVAGVLAAGWFPLYAAALAVHSVEYHVLMYPRIFHTPLDPAARIDRLFARLRTSKLVFYAGVLAVAAVVSACEVVGMGALGGMNGPGGSPVRVDGPVGLVVLVAAFDGLRGE